MGKDDFRRITPYVSLCMRVLLDVRIDVCREEALAILLCTYCIFSEWSTYWCSSSASLDKRAQVAFALPLQPTLDYTDRFFVPTKPHTHTHYSEYIQPMTANHITSVLSRILVQSRSVVQICAYPHI